VRSDWRRGRRHTLTINRTKRKRKI
jgi:hypothetical protein